ncbi:MAG TPA: putative Ig domain-containing protein, partial [Leptospiraceae bacterium]|nr:putative Ig domain-containing protein [Leptospiraceae bacterium]
MTLPKYSSSYYSTMRTRIPLFLFFLFLYLSCSMNSNKKLLGIISLAREILPTSSSISIQYPTNLIFYVNAKVNITPTVQGSISSYSISPSLPSGLSINSSNGAIQGIPTSVASATDYTITAGSLTATVNLQIKNTTSSRVYGQLGDFTTGTSNKGGVSADSLNSPRNCAVDKDDNLYIADTNNNRVLFYLKGSTTATRVYGQLGSFTS